MVTRRAPAIFDGHQPPRAVYPYIYCYAKLRNLKENFKAKMKIRKKKGAEKSEFREEQLCPDLPEFHTLATLLSFASTTRVRV